MLTAYSSLFVNIHDKLYENASLIAEIPGFETIVCHGYSECALIYNNDGEEIQITAEMFAGMLTNSPSYKGGNIRLIACSTGASENGFASQLANILDVIVMAPTETIWVDDNGSLFISNNDILADLWYTQDKEIKETGRWKYFYPERRDV